MKKRVAYIFLLSIQCATVCMEQEQGIRKGDAEIAHLLCTYGQHDPLSIGNVICLVREHTSEEVKGYFGLYRRESDIPATSKVYVYGDDRYNSNILRVAAFKQFFFDYEEKEGIREAVLVLPKGQTFCFCAVEVEYDRAYGNRSDDLSIAVTPLEIHQCNTISQLADQDIYTVCSLVPHTEEYLYYYEAIKNFLEQRFNPRPFYNRSKDDCDSRQKKLENQLARRYAIFANEYERALVKVLYHVSCLNAPMCQRGLKVCGEKPLLTVQMVVNQLVNKSLKNTQATDVVPRLNFSQAGQNQLQRQRSESSSTSNYTYQEKEQKLERKKSTFIPRDYLMNLFTPRKKKVPDEGQSYNSFDYTVSKFDKEKEKEKDNSDS